MVVLSTVRAFGSGRFIPFVLLDASICVVISAADGTSVGGLALSLMVSKTLAIEASQRFWIVCPCLESAESSKFHMSRDRSSEGAEDGARV